MKKTLFLINVAWAVLLIVIIVMSTRVYHRKGYKLDNLLLDLDESKNEVKRIEKEFENVTFKNSTLSKDNKNLVKEFNALKENIGKLESERKITQGQIDSLGTENKSLKSELIETQRLSEEQLRAKKEQLKEELKLAKKSYIDKEGLFNERLEKLNAKLNLFDEKKDYVDNLTLYSIAEIGKEKKKLYYYQKAVSNENNREYDDAIRQYKKVLEIDPDDADAYLQLASIYTYQIQDFEKAEFHAKRYAKLKYIESLMPEDIDDIQKSAEELPLPFLKEKLAEISFAKVNLEGKVSSMKESFKEKQEQINRLKKIAQKKEVIESQLEQTEEIFKEETLKFHYNMALIYDRSKFYKNAAKEYIEALEISPDDPDSHYNLALVYDDHLKDKSKAIRHYKRYLELRPGDSDARKVEYWITRAEKDMESEGKLFFKKKE